MALERKLFDASVDARRSPEGAEVHCDVLGHDRFGVTSDGRCGHRRLLLFDPEAVVQVRSASEGRPGLLVFAMRHQDPQRRDQDSLRLLFAVAVRPPSPAPIRAALTLASASYCLANTTFADMSEIHRPLRTSP
jgi:hypothetical protein